MADAKRTAPDFYSIQTKTGWGRTLSRFVDWCNPQSGWRVLDVGCGPGLLPKLFAQQGCYAAGIDIDPAAFKPAPLHTSILVADGRKLPFQSSAFHLITASNLLFLVDDPVEILMEIRRVLYPESQAVFLNPSEHLTLSAAEQFIDQRQLTGEARLSFLNWAERAESHHRWNEADLKDLFVLAGLEMVESTLIIGPGLARLARTVKK